MVKENQQGFTLIELLAAMAIAGILAGVVVLTLKAGLDTYYFVQDEIFLQKVLDETLQEIADGTFEENGIKDSVEIVEAGEKRLRFVPLWVDGGHTARVPQREEQQEFILSRPFKAGATFPTAEVFTQAGKWQEHPITFSFGENESPLKLDDKITFNTPLPAGTKVRFIYHPEVTHFPECVMTFEFLQEKISRTYKNKKSIIPHYEIPNILVKDFRFQYFDNTNKEIIPDSGGTIDPLRFPYITAVKVTLKASLRGRIKGGNVFINLRNTRTAGSGLIIREGTKISVPNSSLIRALTLVNVTGAKEGGKIKLEARSSQGQSWALNIVLGRKDGKEVLKSYSVESPTGRVVYSEEVNLTTDLPLNLLTLGGNGRYDYDLDEDVEGAVNLQGEVELSVLRMDAAGAALFIRP